jgi:hypothetical protein
MLVTLHGKQNPQCILHAADRAVGLVDHQQKLGSSPDRKYITCFAGLISGLAAACEQSAALLTQQLQHQHQQQQQQQQQQLQQQAEATPVLAKLLSPATAYRLLDLWVWLAEFAPLTAVGCVEVLRTAELVPAIEPAAAARTVMSAAAEGAGAVTGSSSNSISISMRLAAGSSSSSTGGAENTWRSAVDKAQLLARAMAVAFVVGKSINNEYHILVKELEDAGDSPRYMAPSPAVHSRVV